MTVPVKPEPPNPLVTCLVLCVGTILIGFCAAIGVYLAWRIF